MTKNHTFLGRKLNSFKSSKSLNHLMWVVTAEEVNAHLVYSVIKFFVFAEIVTVNPYSHLLPSRVTMLNDLPR